MEQPDIYDLGLNADLQMWQKAALDRRRFLKMGLVSLAAVLVGCQNGGDDRPTAVISSADGANGAAGECVPAIPGETAGPFPADGSPASNQTLNALALAGIVRSDIRTSLATGNTAAGVPCTLELTLVNTNDNCAPLAGYALYLWHCDRDGNYSMYSSAAVDEDYLRGVQVSDGDGKLTFVTIFPGCYPGRWPHAHFEIYPSLDAATNAANVRHTSQLALPEDACTSAYSAAGYEFSAGNLSRLSLATDGVFRDGVASQLAATSGDPAGGFTARLTIGIAA